MSTPHPTHARVNVVVDREIADVLRLEAKKVVMFEHDLFEDFLDFSPDAQYGLSMRFRTAFDVIDILGWHPEKTDPTATSFEVPLTDDLINLLGLRHHDLAMTNADRLDDLDVNEPIESELLAEITITRLAIQALNRLFGAYAEATKA
jgi:hypothetical protein